jgi:hAT family C-terminal dimerisation region
MYGSRYPTWRSIAGDYLAVMASSVASERAFSSAGITVCKRRNRLDGDIVEALQCLKSLINQDLMLRVFPSVADEEALLDDADQQPANQEGSTTDIVKDAEDWHWEVVNKDAADDEVDEVEIIE